VEASWSAEESKKAYLGLANMVARLYKAILPDPAANEFARTSCHSQHRRDDPSLDPEVDISDIMEQVEAYSTTRSPPRVSDQGPNKTYGEPSTSPRLTSTP